jgi:hypothetical protein
MRLNYDQRKHLTSVIDKAAIAYFAVVGYTSYTKGDWLMFLHALVAFAVIEAGALWVLRSQEAPQPKEVKDVD